MSDTQSPEFTTLNAPTVDQPTFSPPVAEPWGSPTTPPPPPPAAKRQWYQMKRVWILGLFALLVGASALGTDAEDSTTTSNFTSPTTYSGSVTTGSSSGSLSGSSSGSASSLTMTQWVTRYGGSDAEMLGDDFTSLQLAAGRMDLDAMVSGCRTLQRHVATVESHLPTPDADLTSALRQAYNYYDQAASYCISGIGAMDPDDIAQSTEYLSLGASAMGRATAVLKRY